MNRTAIIRFKATLAAAVLSLSALAMPAYASGTFSINLQPRNADEERVMRTGLGLYALFNNIQNGGIKQIGNGNSGGLAQNGNGNLGVVHQQGNGHNGTLTQNGNGNAHGLFQFGNNANGHVSQNGNGGTGTTFQFGW